MPPAPPRDPAHRKQSAARCGLGGPESNSRTNGSRSEIALRQGTHDGCSRVAGPRSASGQAAGEPAASPRPLRFPSAIAPATSCKCCSSRSDSATRFRPRRRRATGISRRRFRPGRGVATPRRRDRRADLGDRVLGPRAMGGFIPQPYAQPRPRAPRAAGTLIGRRPRDRRQPESIHADAGLVFQLPRQSRIDHRSDPFDGYRRLGDIGREDDLPPIQFLKCPVLLFGRQFAVQAEEQRHRYRGRVPPPSGGSREVPAGTRARRPRSHASTS